MALKYARRSLTWWWLPMTLMVGALVGVSMLGLWHTFASRQVNGGSPTTPEFSTTPQTDEGGQVKVQAIWLDQENNPTFTITMDTHAVDLDGYDLTQLAVLRTDNGQEVQSTAWDAPKGGHHREGTLSFPATTPDGSPVLTAETRSIELVIRDVAGVSARSFQWKR